MKHPATMSVMVLRAWRQVSLVGALCLLSACSIGSPAPVASPSPFITARVSPVPVASPSPTAIDYLHGVNLPPFCPTSASDQAVCRVNMPGGSGGQATPTGHVGGSWSASSNESILFRIGWADSHQASCQAYIDDTTTTMTVDGVRVAFTQLPCVVAPASASNLPAGIAGLWWTDARYLGAPLSKGVHTASTTDVVNAPFTYYSGCANAQGCTLSAGTTTTFSVIVTVS